MSVQSWGHERGKNWNRKRFESLGYVDIMVNKFGYIHILSIVIFHIDFALSYLLTVICLFQNSS